MIYGNSPWGRQYVRAIPPDEREALEAAIPAGHFISVGARHRPGDWTCDLMRGRPGHAEHVARVEGYRTIVGGCYAVLAKAREIVVERTEGFEVVAEVV